MSQKSLLFALKTFSLSDLEMEEQNPTNLSRKDIESLGNHGPQVISDQLLTVVLEDCLLGQRKACLQFVKQ